jgi:hypothetical protein
LSSAGTPGNARTAETSLNLFSPATYEAFSKSDRTVSGFQEKHQVKITNRSLAQGPTMPWSGVPLLGPYEPRGWPPGND